MIQRAAVVMMQTGLGVALPDTRTRECEYRKSAVALIARIVLDRETMTPKF